MIRFIARLSVLSLLLFPLLFSNNPAFSQTPQSVPIPIAAISQGEVKQTNLVLVADASGQAGQLLEKSGFLTKVWQPHTVLSTNLLVAATAGLTPDDFTAIRQFVQGGGRVLLLAPDGTSLAEQYGLSVQVTPIARALPLDPHDALLSGLLPESLGDWSGGTVAAVTVHRPATGGWRPMLLAENSEETPLLESEYGQGRLIVSTLALTTAMETPAVTRLTHNLIEHLSSPLLPRSDRTLYMGSKSGAALLNRLGVRYRPMTHFTVDAKLVIIAPELRVGVNAEIEKEFVRRGGRVFVLPTQIPLPGVEIRNNYEGPNRLPDWPECHGVVLSDLHPVKPVKTLLLSGKTADGDGLIRRLPIGAGVVLRVQIDPQVFSGNNKTAMLPYDRAIASLLANMGAAFVSPEQRNQPIPPLPAPPSQKSLPVVEATKTVPTIPRKPSGNPAVVTRPAPTIKPAPIPVTQKPESPAFFALTKGWHVKQTIHLTGNDDNKTDPGLSLEARVLLDPEGDDEEWETFDAPGNYHGFDTEDGEAVFRFTLTLPDSWEGKTLELSLGVLDDNDNTYFNGTLVGSMQGKTEPRLYTIPGRLVHGGRNVIAIRLFDTGGAGGFLGPASSLQLKRKGQ